MTNRSGITASHLGRGPLNFNELKQTVMHNHPYRIALPVEFDFIMPAFAIQEVQCIQGFDLRNIVIILPIASSP
jgi:hypothetical protein